MMWIRVVLVRAAHPTCWVGLSRLRSTRLRGSFRWCREDGSALALHTRGRGGSEDVGLRGTNPIGHKSFFEAHLMTLTLGLALGRRYAVADGLGEARGHLRNGARHRALPLNHSPRCGMEHRIAKE